MLDYQRTLLQVGNIRASSATCAIHYTSYALLIKTLQRYSKEYYLPNKTLIKILI